MAVPPHHFDDEPADIQPGGLLDALERRQDDVLSQLDDLDAKLAEVLGGLEPTSPREAAGEPSESCIIQKDEIDGDEHGAGESIDESDGDESAGDESAEDWA